MSAISDYLAEQARAPTTVTADEPYIWWCGDEECDCSQPRIDRVTFRLDTLGNRRQVERVPVWLGGFRSGTLDRREAEEQRRELVIECARRGIDVPEQCRNWRIAAHD